MEIGGYRATRNGRMPEGLDAVKKKRIVTRFRHLHGDECIETALPRRNVNRFILAWQIELPIINERAIPSVLSIA